MRARSDETLFLSEQRNPDEKCEQQISHGCHDAFEATVICNARVTLLSQLRVRSCVVTCMVAQCLAALLYLGVMHGELAHEPSVRDALWKLLEDAHYGFTETEQAMFIVRGADGRLSFVRWDSLAVPRHAQWNGPVPAGVVAIVHTHPNAMPRPSTMDIRTAERSRLPVYVVTHSRVMKTASGETTVVWKGDWRSSAP